MFKTLNCSTEQGCEKYDPFHCGRQYFARAVIIANNDAGKGSLGWEKSISRGLTRPLFLKKPEKGAKNAFFTVFDQKRGPGKVLKQAILLLSVPVCIRGSKYLD